MNWTLFILLFIGLGTILTTVLVAKSSGKTPSVLGYQLYVVQSGSMIPTLHIGTLILSKAFDESLQLKKGDVVTFTSDGMTVTHRIIEVLSANGQIQYRTKGDNPENAVDQGLLSADRIKAVMIMRIPFT